MIEGTRIGVEQVLGLLANGMTVEAIVRSYPILQPEDIRAALAHARQSLRNESFLNRAKR